MSLTDAILSHAAERPHAPAVLASDGNATYADLVTRATALSAAFQRRGVVAGDRIAVVMPPGRDAITTALAAFLLRVAYVPIDPSQPAARVQQMMLRCKPRLCVEREPMHRPDVDTASPDDLAGIWPSARTESAVLSARPAANDVAYVIHTSGSSGTPKAVEVEHGSLVNLIDDLDRRAPMTDGYVGAWWCSPDFDVAIWEMWAPLARGGAVAVVPPEDRWEGDRVAMYLDSAEVASAYVPASFLPNLRDYLARRPRSGLALRRLLVGVEPIPLGLLQEIMRLRSGVTIVNGYGPAETTICCTLYRVPRTGGNPASRTPIGTAVRGNRLLLLGDDGIPGYGSGELVVAGAGVARGYVGIEDPASFILDPAGDPAVRAYRTGDIVRALPDGNLVYEGRVDRQLKIRGYRIEPSEVEAVIAAIAGIREVVVDRRDSRGSPPELVAYVVPERGQVLRPRQLRAMLTGALPTHAIPTAFVAVPRIPLTANGKVDRQALTRLPLPSRGDDATTDGMPPDPSAARPSTNVATILDAWRVALVGAVDEHSSFIALGGTSISAARAAALLRAETGRAVSARDMLDARSAVHLADSLEQRARKIAPSDTATGLTRGPLSVNQLGLWLHDRLTPGEPTYLEPLCFVIDGDIDEHRLAHAVRAAAAARPAFGAVVDASGPEPEIVLGHHSIALQTKSAPHGESLLDVARREFDHPIDLSKGPLVRCILLQMRGGPSALLLLWHHIIVDGWSVRGFLDDVASCYRSPSYHPVGTAYTICDATTWLRQRSDEPHTAARTRRIVSELGDNPPFMASNPDGRADAPGPTIRVDLPPGAVARVSRAARHAEIAPFAFIAAAYQRAIADVLARDRFVLGCAVAGRTQPELETVAGYFVNTVLMPSQVWPGRSGSALVADTARAFRRARTHQEDTPLAKLVAQMRAAGCELPARMPQLYLSVDDDYVMALEGADCEQLPLYVERARFDATLSLRSRPTSLHGVFEFRLTLLSEHRAALLVERFGLALDELADAGQADDRVVRR